MESITITAKQTADKLGVHKNTLYRLIHAGGFYPAIKVGKKVVVLKDDLDKWINEQKGLKI